MTLTPSPSADDFDALERALWFAWRASRVKAPDDPVGYQADFIKGFAARRAQQLNREQEDGQ